LDVILGVSPFFVKCFSIAFNPFAQHLRKVVIFC
jgi:hypothetical protein